MRNIYAIGETVLDIIYKNGKVVSSTPGGSMLNTSVSLGRIRFPISFISEIGKDLVGIFILGFLKKNGVNTNRIDLFEDGKSALALAFLDENENAEYSFYKSYPKERLNVTLPDFNVNDVFLFGSFFSIDREVRDKIQSILISAKSNDCICIYDPNFRMPHIHDLPFVMEYIKENISYADIVRGSNEDFQLIFGTQNADDTFEHILKCGSEVLIYTKGGDSVEVRTKKLKLFFPVEKVELKSTIGAGDTFNSGIVYKLYSLGIDKKSIVDLSQECWSEIIMTSITFAAEVCQSFENFISIETANNYALSFED